MEVQYGIICFIQYFNKDKKDRKITSYIKNLFLISVSAQILIIPIIARNYNTISLTFFITNILTSSLIGVIIIFGFLLIVISFINIEIAKILGSMYKAIIQILLIIAKYMSQIPLSKIYVKTPSMLLIIAYYIFIFTNIYFYKKYKTKYIIRIYMIIKSNFKKIIAVTLSIILIINLCVVITPRKMYLYFIDVGQGDSCLIITPENTNILIDVGGQENYDVRKKYNATILIR